MTYTLKCECGFSCDTNKDLSRRSTIRHPTTLDGFQKKDGEWKHFYDNGDGMGNRYCLNAEKQYNETTVVELADALSPQPDKE